MPSFWLTKPDENIPVDVGVKGLLLTEKSVEFDRSFVSSILSSSSVIAESFSFRLVVSMPFCEAIDMIYAISSVLPNAIFHPYFYIFVIE